MFQVKFEPPPSGDEVLSVPGKLGLPFNRRFTAPFIDSRIHNLLLDKGPGLGYSSGVGLEIK